MDSHPRATRRDKCVCWLWKQAVSSEEAWDQCRAGGDIGDRENGWIMALEWLNGTFNPKFLGRHLNAGSHKYSRIAPRMNHKSVPWTSPEFQTCSYRIIWTSSLCRQSKADPRPLCCWTPESLTWEEKFGIFSLRKLSPNHETPLTTHSSRTPRFAFVLKERQRSETIFQTI